LDKRKVKNTLFFIRTRDSFFAQSLRTIPVTVNSDYALFTVTGIVLKFVPARTEV